MTLDDVVCKLHELQGYDAEPYQDTLKHSYDDFESRSSLYDLLGVTMSESGSDLFVNRVFSNQDQRRILFAPFAKYFHGLTLNFVPTSDSYEHRHQQLASLVYKHGESLDGQAFEPDEHLPVSGIWQQAERDLAKLLGPPDDEGQNANKSENSDGSGEFIMWKTWDMSDRTIQLNQRYVQNSRPSKYQPFPKGEITIQLTITYEHDSAYREMGDHLSVDWRPVHNALAAAQK